MSRAGRSLREIAQQTSASAAIVLTVVTSLIAPVVSTSCRGGDDASKRAASLELLGQVPSFSLTDQSGKPFGDGDLVGKVVIANFVFTRCPTVCPVFTRKFRALIESLDDVEPMLFVSISVDPTHDTSEVLEAYAAKHDADPSRWKFLTGDPEAIKATAEDGLKLAMERSGTLPDGTPDIVHATHFVLIDQQGRIRGYYDSDEKERRTAIAADARALAASASK